MVRRRSFSTIFLLLALFAVPFAMADPGAGPFEPTDWPMWRGPSQTGHASLTERPPLNWSNSNRIAWKTAIEGTGHSSPIVFGPHIVLATASDANQQRSVCCYDRKSGVLIWKTAVHQGKLTPAKNSKGTDASSTLAYDGTRLFINFLHDDGMYTSALATTGEILWQTRVSDYVVHQGFGSSPTIYESLVIVTADNKSGGAVAGLDRLTGKIVWKVPRPSMPNYSSPVIYEIGGRDQLVLTGCDLVAGLNPRSGAKFWEVAGATTECVTTTVTDGRHIYSSGGYPDNHVSAVVADGSAKLAWRNGIRVYVPSMIINDGHLFAVADAGVAYCWKSYTGEEKWRGRLGGTFTSSLVLADQKLYVTNESGKTFVFNANPNQFELLAQNQLGDECFATPAFSDNRIYHRVAVRTETERQEYLICVGDPF